jgi:adhesin transport system outer membrane protein
MSLNSAVQAAAAWHPSVRNAAGQLLQADEGITGARSGYYPQVRAGITNESRNRDIAAYGTRNLNQGRISVSQMIYDFGKVANSVDQARAGADAARAQVQWSVDAVIRETALTWVELSRQQAMSKIATSQVEGVKALADLAKEREAKGASTRSDALQAQARVESAASQAVNISTQVQRNRVGLMQLTGSKVPVSSDGAAPQLLDQACSAGATGLPTPAVLRAEALREQARATVRVADSALLPTLSLDGSVLRGIDRQSRMSGQGGMESTITLNFSAPLYEGGASQSRQRAALHALEAADAAVEQAQLQVRQGLLDAQTQTQGQRARAPVLAQRIESIRTTRDLYREQYLQLGTRSLLDLLNAEQEYHSARFDQLDSTYEQQRLAIECLYQGGRLRDAFNLSTSFANTGAQP